MRQAGPLLLFSAICAAGGCAPATRGNAEKIALASACEAPRVPLLGACVEDEDARAFCGGPLASAASGACAAFPACEFGEAVDARTEACVPAIASRALAKADGLELASENDDERPGCHEGAILVVTGNRLTCLPAIAVAPRDGVFHEGAGPSRTDGALDTSLWARAVLGSSGGHGSSALCAPLGRDPGHFGVRPGHSATIELAIELNFPDNDVQGVHANVTTDVPGARARAEEAVSTLLPALRALGGRSSSGAVTVRVTCDVTGGVPPLALTKKTR